MQRTWGRGLEREWLDVGGGGGGGLGEGRERAQKGKKGREFR
jgi:hypothetical protein